MPHSIRAPAKEVFFKKYTSPVGFKNKNKKNDGLTFLSH